MEVGRVSEGLFPVCLNSSVDTVCEESIHGCGLHCADDSCGHDDVPVCLSVLLAVLEQKIFLVVVEVRAEVFGLRVRLDDWLASTANVHAVVLASRLQEDTFRLEVSLW